MSDSGATLPFDLDGAASAPPRRRRRWPWIVTTAIVAVLVLGAAVGAEALARGAVVGGVRQLVVSQLGLPADQHVEVEVPGLVLPQLLSGRIGRITVAAPDFERGPISGDVSVTLTEVPLAVDRAAGPGTASVRLDETQLRALLGTIDGFPADTVAIDGTDIALSTELSVFGAGVPVGIALQPGADGGDLTLTPTRFRLGDADVSADDVRSRFGALADTVLRQWSVCVAQHLPAALTLTSATVEGGALLATFDIDGAIVVDPALRAEGTCG